MLMPIPMPSVPLLLGADCDPFELLELLELLKPTPGALKLEMSVRVPLIVPVPPIFPLMALLLLVLLIDIELPEVEELLLLELLVLGAFKLTLLVDPPEDCPPDAGPWPTMLPPPWKLPPSELLPSAMIPRPPPPSMLPPG